MSEHESARPSIETTPRGTDRRVGPRRESERNLHYAEVNLLAAAIAAADYHETGLIGADPDPLGALVAAAKVYGAATAEAGR
jgi:hypothetical protein